MAHYWNSWTNFWLWLRSMKLSSRVGCKENVVNLIIGNGWQFCRSIYNGQAKWWLNDIRKLTRPLRRIMFPYKSWINAKFPLRTDDTKIMFGVMWFLRITHLFFGRLWINDWETRHDRKKNTYNFTFKGQKLILKKMKIEEATERKATYS